MSRTKPRTISTSPVTAYFTWKGGETRGDIELYDKSVEDKDNRTTNIKTLEFMILDETHSVTGFTADEKRISGTVIHSFDEQIQTFIGGNKGELGFYKDLKKNIEGLKYAKHLYVVAFVDGTPHFGVIKLSGAAFGAWMDFVEAEGDFSGGEAIGDLYNTGFKISGKSKVRKKGAVKYYCPVFEEIVPTSDQTAKAEEYDSILQEYFVNKSAKPAALVEASDTEEDPHFKDDLPY